MDRFGWPVAAKLVAAGTDFCSRNRRRADDLESVEYDTTVKVALYAIVGVQEYWVADLRNNRLIAYSDPAGDSYRKIHEYHPGDTVAPHLLPNCRLQVDILLS